MSGTPSEAEIQTQWRNVVDLLEDTRNFADGTVAGAAGLLDVLLQSLEGEYTPERLSRAAAVLRGNLSAAISPGLARNFLDPLLFEYQRFMGNAPYSDPQAIMRVLYERFVANSLTVESRNITYDTAATTSNPSRGGSIIGNGSVARLTTDENGFALEACTVETKTIRCRVDKNSGGREFAEQFELYGAPLSQDSLLRAARGSGISAPLFSLHAGSGAGGSYLNNGSFETFSSGGSPKFEGWTESAGGANIAQHTANTYRGYPGAPATLASLRLNGGSGIITLKQSLTDFRQKRLDPNTPYFFRVMVNPTVGSASGGTFAIRLGSIEESIDISSMDTGWQEIAIPFDETCWFRQFNEQTLDVEIEWDASSTSGYLLVDDAILAPFTPIDGTYWAVRQDNSGPVSWAVDDTLVFTDTGGAPATAKIQWWLWASGLGYLPSTTGSPTFAEP